MPANYSSPPPFARVQQWPLWMTPRGRSVCAPGLMVSDGREVWRASARARILETADCYKAAAVAIDRYLMAVFDVQTDCDTDVDTRRKLGQLNVELSFWLRIAVR